MTEHIPRCWVCNKILKPTDLKILDICDRCSGCKPDPEPKPLKD